MPNNYVLLERTELNASAASVTFANIPQTGYTDLKIVMSARLDVNDVQVKTYFNADTTAANYSWRRLYGDGASTVSDSGTNLIAGSANAANNTASTFGNMELYIPNYTSSNSKSVSSDQVTENNATTAYQTIGAFRWTGTAAINTITLLPNTTGNFVANSTFSLYGLAALGTTPARAPKASGGNVIATDGTYWYHAFLASGTFTPQVGLTADVLMAGGGGAGGYDAAGGGGAGGVIYATSTSLTNATGYSVAVGAGGTAAGGGASTNGVNSTFNSFTAIGGGYGGDGTPRNGNSGGSGGGASYSGTGGAATQGSGTGYTGYGNAGGNGGSNYRGAGGGGAGTAGATSAASGNGGAGLNTWSSWLSAVALGVSGYIAGGGGGGNASSGAAPNGSGGAGGGGTGGNGVSSVNATAGTVNTGSGGGGGRGGQNGGAGGSGIVIIRYLAA